MFALYVFTGCCVENRHFFGLCNKDQKICHEKHYFHTKICVFQFHHKKYHFFVKQLLWAHMHEHFLQYFLHFTKNKGCMRDKTILLDLSLFTLSYRKLARIISTCTTREHYTGFSGKDACARYCPGAEIRDQRNNIFANFLFRRYDKIVVLFRRPALLSSCGTLIVQVRARMYNQITLYQILYNLTNTDQT